MTTLGKPRGGCEFTNTPDGMMVSCSRRSSRPTCAYCKSRPAEYACDYPYRGAKAGKFCDGRACESCASVIVGEVDRHLCPPHRRAVDKEAADADRWLAELVATTKREATCTCPTSSRWPHYGDPECPVHRVDNVALESMFPDWERDLGDEPPVSALAGEIRARGDEWLDKVAADQRAMSAAKFAAEHANDLARNAGVVGTGNVTATQAAAVPREDQERLDIIASHAWDGDTCERCGTQAMPNGHVDGTCAELLQAQVNMYGCRPCPKCHDEYRSPATRDVTDDQDGNKVARVTCDGCGFVSTTRYVELSETFGLGYYFEGWLDVPELTKADVVVDRMVARHGDAIPHDEAIVRDYARRLSESMAAPPRTLDDVRAENDPAVNQRATIEDKVRHVRTAKQTREHGCHWPGCKRQVPPAKWGCLPHWKMLPRELQRAIWDAYRPGQEETLTPSRAYLEAADRVQKWIRGYLEREATTPGEPRRTSWGEAVHRSRTQDRVRAAVACVYCGQLDVPGHGAVCPNHPDPQAQAESLGYGDITESEVDPDVGDR